MQRAIDELINRGLYAYQIGSAENNEMNPLAYTKAIRSELMLKEVYGFSDELETDAGVHVDLFMFMLSAELNSVFFWKDYVSEFRAIYGNNDSLCESLSILAFNGLVGWSVSQAFPKGNKNITKTIIEAWTVDLKELEGFQSSLYPQPCSVRKQY